MTLRLIARLSLAPVMFAAMMLAACEGPHETPAPPEQPVRGWAHETSPLRPDPAVRFGRLENGLRYAVLPNATPDDAASLRLVLDAGSLLENEDERGLAHFVEHMAFRGTTNVPEGAITPILERYGLAFGADANAATSFDFVIYKLDLPSADEARLEAGLFLLREAAGEVVFDPAAIDRERGVVLSEERFRNTPIARYQDALFRFLFPRALIAERMPIGLEEVVREAPREAFQAYYERAYRPDRALLIIVGDVDPDAVETMLREGFEIDIPGLEAERAASFASWAAPETPLAAPRIGDIEALAAPEFGYFYDPDVISLINVEIVTPERAPPDTLEARKTRILRGLGLSIVQRRLQSRVNAGESALLGVNLFDAEFFGAARRTGVSAVAAPARWREGLAEIEQAVRAARDYGFSQAELDEQLANLRNAVSTAAGQAGTRETAELADALFDSWRSREVFLHPAEASALFERLEPELTVEAVEAAFEGMWGRAAPRVFVAGSTAMEDGAAEVEAAWRRARAQPVEPPRAFGPDIFAYTDFGPPGDVAARAELEDLGVVQYRFANNVRLNVKPTDFESDAVHVRVDFGAGARRPAPSAGMGGIVCGSFGGGGLEAHDADALQRLLAGRSVSWGLCVEDESFVFSHETTPADFELQLQLVAAFLSAPGWREDGLRRFRAIAPEVRRNQNADAAQLAAARLPRLLRSGDPRWGFPTAEEVDAFSMEAARDWLAEPLARGALEVTVVGDVTAERARDAVARTLGALPEREFRPAMPEETAALEFPAPQAEPVVLRFNGQPNQARVGVYWPTQDASDIRTARAAGVLASVLRIRALDVLRQREGATFSPMVENVMSEVFPGYGYMGVSMGADAAGADRAIALIEAVAQSLYEDGVSADDLIRAREPILSGLQKDLERNAFWLERLARSQRRPQRVEALRSLEADYRAVTAEQVEALAERWLRPERALRVEILPRTETGGAESARAGR